MLYDPVTKYKTATKFDTCEAADPIKLAKVAQKMRSQVPDPAAVDGKRLPLPVPKSGVALMAELDPEGAKRGAIAMEEDEARRARGASYTLVPIRPRRRCERRSLRTLPGVSLRPSLAFNPRLRRLSTPTDAFEHHPDVALNDGTTLRRWCRRRFRFQTRARIWSGL